MSVVEDGKEAGTHKRILSSNVEMHEVIRLQETSTLQFWVTASTKVLIIFQSKKKSSGLFLKEIYVILTGR